MSLCVNNEYHHSCCMNAKGESSLSERCPLSVNMSWCKDTKGGCSVTKFPLWGREENCPWPLPLSPRQQNNTFAAAFTSAEKAIQRGHCRKSKWNLFGKIFLSSPHDIFYSYSTLPGLYELCIVNIFTSQILDNTAPDSLPSKSILHFNCGH